MSTPISDLQREQLRDLRRGLLRLHKLLLDIERATYEKARGPVSPGELLQLVINHEQFAWLHAISELVVRIDEGLDAKEGINESDARALLEETKALLSPSEKETSFAKKYLQVLQDVPDVVLAHREVVQILNR